MKYTKTEIKEISKENRTMIVIGSKEVIDRDNEIVKLDGMNLSNYKSNSVVLWMHDRYNLPIGKATKVYVEGKKLMFHIKFATKDENPLADSVYKLYKGGFLKSFSVGFRPNYDTITYDKKNDGTIVRKINDSELFEISAVNIPANKDAVVQSIGKAFDEGIITKEDSEHLQEMFNKSKELEELKELKKQVKRLKELYEELSEKEEDNEGIYKELYDEYSNNQYSDLVDILKS